MTPDSAPTVQQLLTFYLEAGVDCALTEEPVNRLSDPDTGARRQRSRAPPKPVRTIRRGDPGCARRASACAGGRDPVGAGSGADRADRSKRCGR